MQRTISFEGKAKKEEGKEEKRGKRVQRIIPSKEEKKETLPLCLASGCWAACPATRWGSPRQPQPRPACGPTDGPTGGSFFCETLTTTEIVAFNSARCWFVFRVCPRGRRIPSAPGGHCPKPLDQPALG